MRELSLFTGVGGGILGSLLLGWTPIGYVEYDEYCQRVIAQRIADGILPSAPIFGDVHKFVQSSAAREYRGFTDVLTAGFPCQPFSSAGERRGTRDKRNMWPYTIECIRIIQPRYCLLENVRGLLTSGYFQEILKDLAESGYDARWRCLSAAEVGASHKRDRLWIVAYPHSQGLEGLHSQSGEVDLQSTGRTVSRHIWSATPRVYRRTDGISQKVDRLKALGNAQFPAVAAAAWNLLTE